MAEHQTGRLFLDPRVVSEGLAVFQPVNFRFRYPDSLTVQSDRLRRRIGLGDGGNVELRLLVNFHPEGLGDSIDGVVGHTGEVVGAAGLAAVYL